MQSDPLADWLTELSVDFPFFVRSVVTASAAGPSRGTIDERAGVILEEVLALDPAGEISVYLVDSPEELLKVTLTLCLFRGMDEGRVYAITPKDLQGLPFRHSEANCNIPCFYTRSRHHDLTLSQGQREELARRLAVHVRAVSPKIRKNRTKPFRDQAIADRCYSTTADSTGCAGCDPAGQKILQSDQR
jgi:hypothetical protein